MPTIKGQGEMGTTLDKSETDLGGGSEKNWFDSYLTKRYRLVIFQDPRTWHNKKHTHTNVKPLYLDAAYPLSVLQEYNLGLYQ